MQFNKKKRNILINEIDNTINLITSLNHYNELPPIAGKAMALLSFDVDLYNGFKKAFEYRHDSDEFNYESCLGDMVSILHQASSLLKHNLIPSKKNKKQKHHANIESDKITFSWLLNNVPIKMYIIAVSFIIAIFVTGIGLGSSIVFQQYIKPIAKEIIEADPLE